MDPHSSVPNALFRYYSEKQYADRFLAGELLFRPLAYYRNFEDEQVRGDANEGLMSYGPRGGLEITKSAGEPVQGFKYFNGEVREDEIFVFCLSDAPSASKAAAFGGFCVEVIDIAALLARVEAALPAGAGPLFSRKVTYDDPEAPPEARWACPDLIVGSKWPAYAWQDEHRLFFSLTNALDFENCHYTVSTVLRPRPKRATPLPDPIPITILRGLGDICRLRN